LAARRAGDCHHGDLGVTDPKNIWRAILIIMKYAS
jgi:hypothetical protein